MEQLLKSKDKPNTQEITLDLTWTVTFDSKGGGEVASQTIANGGRAACPANPTKAGFDFANWYDNASLNEPCYDFDTPVTADITLYAKWGEITLPLTDVNDIEPYFEGRTGGDSIANPEPLSFKLDLGIMMDAASNWQKMLTHLNAVGKFVDLDLSLCTMDSMNGVFNPYYKGDDDSPGKAKIVSIALPDTATSIVDGLDDHPVFGNFDNLKSFSGAGLSTIGDWTFSGCVNLALTSLPAGITEIGDYAFYGCTSLSTITLPDGLQNIGAGAFYGCTSLTSISLPATVSISYNGVFMHCTSLALFDVRGTGSLSTIEGRKALVQNGELLSYPTAAGTITLPAGISSIGIGAFYYCTGLKDITLPASLNKIIDNAFRDCTNLLTVTCYAATPPSPGALMFNGTNANLKIYVPAASVDTYRAEWSTYQDKIFPIGGDGTENAPFLISTAAELRQIGSGNWGLDKHYKLMGNIPLTGTWTPIGTYNPYNPGDFTITFTGSFDGGGYSISNLNITLSEIFQGMFGAIGPGGEVKNLALIDCIITGADYVGGVAGGNAGTVDNCYVTGTVSGNDYVGGVVGGILVGTVKNCYTTGNVSGNDYVGGVAGGNADTVENCYATGNVSGNKYFGGVVGSNDGTVKNCVGLNKEINPNSGTILNYGRVVGSGGTKTNNYGRGDMGKPGGGDWVYTGPDNDDGANITEAQWNNATWWTGTAQWSTAVWDIANNRLPILKEMPAGTQNPAVQ